MSRRIVAADETDAYSKHRRLHGAFRRARAVKKIKVRTHRRERREGRVDIRDLKES